MPLLTALEPAVAISLWINAAKAGSVTRHDAANACETITGQMELSVMESSQSWLNFIEMNCEINEPVVAVLPVEGDLRGVPSQLFTKAHPNFGLVAITRNLLLLSLDGSQVTVVQVDHRIAFPDTHSARLQMAEAVSEAEEVLQSFDLVGSRLEIDKKIDESVLRHIPPIGRQRDNNDLHSAFRMRLVIDYARNQSIAISSPSNDLHRINILNQLDKHVRDLIIAIASKVPA